MDIPYHSFCFDTLNRPKSEPCLWFPLICGRSWSVKVSRNYTVLWLVTCDLPGAGDSEYWWAPVSNDEHIYCIKTVNLICRVSRPGYTFSPSQQGGVIRTYPSYSRPTSSVHRSLSARILLNSISVTGCWIVTWTCLLHLALYITYTRSSFLTSAIGELASGQSLLLVNVFPADVDLMTILPVRVAQQTLMEKI